MTTESRADFARRMTQHIGRPVARSTVTRWAEKGRIVMIGELVDVEASLALLAATQGSRFDVSDRHTVEHAEKIEGMAVVAPANGIPEAAQEANLQEVRLSRAVSESRIKAAEAEMREMERDEMAKRLIRAEDVNFALDDFGATLRGLMDNLADRLAPILFPLQSLEETHAALSDTAENILSEMSAALRRRAAQGAV